VIQRTIGSRQRIDVPRISGFRVCRELVSRSPTLPATEAKQLPSNHGRQALRRPDITVVGDQRHTRHVPNRPHRPTDRPQNNDRIEAERKTTTLNRIRQQTRRPLVVCLQRTSQGCKKIMTFFKEFVFSLFFSLYYAVKHHIYSQDCGKSLEHCEWYVAQN